jgi:hypothetical protein
MSGAADIICVSQDIIHKERERKRKRSIENGRERRV